MEGDDFEGDGVGEDDNLFKSKLVQRTSIPQLAVLKNSDSNGELNLNTSPSFGGANVYPLKPHIGLSENIPTYTEKNMMTNSDAEQLKRFLQAENTYEGKILCPKCMKRQ